MPFRRYWAASNTPSDETAADRAHIKPTGVTRNGATLLTGVLLLAACGQGGSHDATPNYPLRIGVYQGSIFSMPFYVAEQKEFFKKHGLTVTLVPVASGPAAMAAVASDSIQVFAAAPEIVLPAVEKGLDFKLIGGVTKLNWILLTNNAGTAGAVRDQPYPDSLKPLRGKKVGVVALGSSSATVLTAMLKDAGLKADEVTLVGVGLGAGAAAALESGRIDAVISDSSAAAAILASGKGSILVDLRAGKAGPASLRGRDYEGYFTTGDYLKKNRQVVTALRKAMCETDRWMHAPANLTEVTSMFGSLIGIPASVVQEDTALDLKVLTCAFTRSSIEAFIAFDVQYGFLEHSIDVSKVYDPETPQTNAG